MLADAHRDAALDIEAAVTTLATAPHASRLIIEGAWGAAFHWIAFGCQTKYGARQDSHARLGAFLRSHRESNAANTWERLDQVRQGGWYGTRTDPQTQATALDLLGELRQWATS
jgi:hypothetical protein